MTMVFETMALLLIGFSVFASLLLCAAQFTVYRNVEFDLLTRLAGPVLLAGLAWLQMLHAGYLLGDSPDLPTPLYRILLFVVAPAFFIFFEGALAAGRRSPWSRVLLFLPASIAGWLPGPYAIPVAFALGAFYAAILTHRVFRLRDQRKRFRLEALAFAAHAVVALAILFLGLFEPWIGLEPFVLGYSILIGLGFLAALYTLLRFPDLAQNTVEAVRSAYANTSLRTVDVDAAIARLDKLMSVDRIYTNDSLSLSSLAEQLGLGPHQLSELLNARLGIGFSRFVREHRVRAAQRMLLDEPTASVLSVGLAVGFTSQSNFYAAFREITGEVPGRFRRSSTARTAPEFAP